MKTFRDLREFIWPLLDKEKIRKPKKFKKEKVIVRDEFLDKTVEYAFKLYQEENERKKTVETKSSVFIGLMSVIMTIIVGVTTLLLKEKIVVFWQAIFMTTFFVLTIYLTRTIWFSIKALERRNYHSISIEQFLNSNESGDYQREIITNIINNIQNNYKTINEKVDNMTMAQEYFKRVICVIVMYAVFIFSYFISLIL